jgi:transcriptional regulator with XRE-family HTH domain
MAINGKRAPGMLDMLAGRWLRAWRMSAGVSREEFAARAQITVQQIQKYEDGSNRISASRLAQFAEIVERAPGDFFIGAEILQSAFAHDDAGAPVDADTCDLLIEYFRSGSEVARERIAEIVRSASKPGLEDHGCAVYVLRRPTEFRKAA